MRFPFVLNLLFSVLAFNYAAWAQVSPPQRGGNIGIVRVDATEIELNVGVGGTGQGRVVAFAEIPDGIPVLLAPIDGQFYQGSAVYGQGSMLGKGYAVYAGPDHTVTITGLKPNTPYYITNSEYNSDGTSIRYNLGSNSITLTTRKASVAFKPAAAPLPVTLVSFTGTVDAYSLATLGWTTASEHNNAYFVVERSSNGTTFGEVGQVRAAGSSQGATYQYADPQALRATTYYRLRQVDQDGTAHYSNVLTLQPAPPLARQISIYPNPGASQTIKLALQGYENSPLSIQVLDALGRAIASQTVTPQSGVCAIALLPNTAPGLVAIGTYLVKIKGDNVLVQQRITITE